MGEIPGIQSILVKPASEVWPGESKPVPELERLIDGAPQLFEMERFVELGISLDEIARFELESSQTMRLNYWRGKYLNETNDASQALALFDIALSIATGANDLASMIVITIEAANALYNRTQYRNALTYYAIALDAWHNKMPDPSTRNTDTEIMLQTFVGDGTFLVGEIDESHQIFARALALALRAPRASRTLLLQKETANALWTLCLVLRAQSDMRDGDEGYLNTALRRMRKAVGLYEHVGVEAKHLGRFDIQIAEVYLDLAELHLQRGATQAARAMRTAGFARIDQTRDYLKYAGDGAGEILERITRLRASVMWPGATKSVRAIDEINATLTKIEHDAAALNDRILIAKVATLRAEWLISLGDKEAARDALLWALKGFNPDGMGMATRAQRLLRRLN